MLRKIITALALAALLSCPADALTGTRRVLISGNSFIWVQPGAAVDFDLAGGRTFGCTIASCLSLTRASPETNLLPSSPAGFAYTSYGNGVFAFNANGLQIYESRTNQLLNSTAPATQTTPALAATAQTLWVNGSGSAALSNGTATGCTGTATNGSPVTFTPTAGTCTVTVTGSLFFFQLEAGAFGTPGIVTAGSPVTRANDDITATGNLLAVANGTTGGAYVQFIGNGQTIPFFIAGNNHELISSSSGKANMWNGTTALQATAGSGGLTTGGKIASAWTPSSRRLQFNNGVVASDANGAGTGTPIFIGRAAGGGSYLDSTLQRMTLFSSNTLAPTQ